jgi:hypothetical protein
MNIQQMNKEELKKEFNSLLGTYKPTTSGDRKAFEYAKQHKEEFIDFLFDMQFLLQGKPPYSHGLWEAMIAEFWYDTHPADWNRVAWLMCNRS